MSIRCRHRLKIPPCGELMTQRSQVQPFMVKGPPDNALTLTGVTETGLNPIDAVLNFRLTECRSEWCFRHLNDRKS